MRELRNAGVVWLLLAFLGLLSLPGEAPPPTVPRWPVALRVNAPRGGSFCASRELPEALRGRAFAFVAGSGRERPRWTRELSLNCAEQEVPSQGLVGGVELTAPGRGEPFYSDAFAVPKAPTRGERAALAAEIADRLAAEPSVVGEAESVFLAAQNDLAQAGARAFENGDWNAASRLLFQGLEGLPDPGQAYYGLSVGAAKLGEAQRAWWFAAAYLKATGKPASAAPLDHLNGLAPDAGLDPEAGGAYAEARRLIEQRQLAQAFVVLKGVCELIPWDPRPAEAVAEIYDGLGWPRVAALWRARAAMAREIAAHGLGLLPDRAVP